MRGARVCRPMSTAVVASMCVAAGVLVGGTPAMAARGHIFCNTCTFGSASSTVIDPEPLTAPAGVAVNEATGQVYVVDRGNNRVEYFSSTGAYEDKFDGSGAFSNENSRKAPHALSEPEGIAIDNDPLSPSHGDVYVVDTGNKVVDKFGPTGEYIGQMSASTVEEHTTNEKPGEPFGSLFGVAVDSSGMVWVYLRDSGDEPEVATFSDGEPNVYTASHEVTGEVVFFEGATAEVRGPEAGLAVDSEDHLYVHSNFVASGTNVISKLGPTGTPVLIYGLDHESSSSVAVEMSTGDPYVGNLTSVARFTPSGSPIERLGEEKGAKHLTQSSGIAANSSTEQVYVADSTGDEVDVFDPEPPSKPVIEEESVSQVSSTGATITAEIKPNTEASESKPDATYYFHTCGAPPSSCTDVSLPPGSDIGSGFDGQSVSVHLADLQPGVRYHFDVVAVNKFGETEGAEETFTTRAAQPGPELPDGRAWELVSPSDLHGGLILPIGETGLIQAAADGSAITYKSTNFSGSEPAGETEEPQLLSTRAPDGGWSTEDVVTPNSSATGNSIGQGEEYRFFSTNLASAVVEPRGKESPPLSPEASERTVYLRDNGCGSELQCAAAGAQLYRALVATAPGYENVPHGTNVNGNPENLTGAVKFVGASLDASHVILESEVALAASPAAPGLYEWAGGKLQFVSVLENGTAAGGASLGSHNGVNTRGAVSTDGLRVVWDAGEHLYLRDTATEETIEIDAQQGVSGGTPQARFQVADGEDTRVFFTDTQKLTPGSTAAYEEPDLYVFELNTKAATLEGKLTDLTEHAGELANVQGTVLGAASEEGSYIYFVAKGVLAGKNAEGNEPEKEADNLYVARFASAAWQQPTFIATLAKEDQPDWAGGGGLPGLTAGVSPNGRWLSFMSSRPLTGYDNADAISGMPDEEVYLYEAQAERLVCASCDPTGARPVGIEYAKLTVGNGGFVGGDRVWANNTWLAANIPGWTPYSQSVAAHQARYLADSGRLFFNSSDALAPQDTNGVENVYEYEPAGAGSCTSSSTTFSASSGGCVASISSGTSTEESAFLDASEGGEDVFFLTSAKLVVADEGSALEVYDAHVCSAAAPCATAAVSSPLPCATAEVCKAPPPSSPALGLPASLTFSGAGNMAPSVSKLVTKKTLTRTQKLAKALAACRKKKSKRKRAVCEKQARKSYGAKASGAKGARKANASKRGRG